MEKRDKLKLTDGNEIDCNIVGFYEGLYGKRIIIYTTADNEKELLASYCTLKENVFTLEEIDNEEEWVNLEKSFKELEEKLAKKEIKE